MVIMDGKSLQNEVIENLKQEVRELSSKPKLAIIQVGHDAASNKYVEQKMIVGSKIGIEFLHINYEEDITEDIINKKIAELNKDSTINGIMVQLPLPAHLNSERIIDGIEPLKDVDGLTTLNTGLLFDNKRCLIPCTALGVMDILNKYNIALQGKHVVLVGRSELIGKPLIACMLKENATVTVTHSKTVDLASITKTADVLVVGVGKPRFITSDMVKDGAVVIDVGTNFVDGKLIGDVDFDNVSPKTSYITPVPNGVGRMTVSSLMKNVVLAYKLQKELNNS